LTPLARLCHRGMASHGKTHHVDRLTCAERRAQAIQKYHLSMTAISYWTVSIIKTPHEFRRALLPISRSDDSVAALDESHNVEVLVARRCKLS